MIVGSEPELDIECKVDKSPFRTHGQGLNARWSSLQRVSCLQRRSIKLEVPPEAGSPAAKKIKEGVIKWESEDVYLSF